MKQKLLAILIFITVLAIFTSNSFAVDFTWTGGAGTNDWHTSGNWSPIGAVPGIDDTVTIPNTAPYQPVIYSTGASSIVEINIDSGSSLNITGGMLTVLDDATCEGALTIDGGNAVFELVFDTLSTGSVALFSGTITFNDTTDIVTLNQNGGEITGTGDMTVNSFFDWTMGTISGSGAFNLSPTCITNIEPGSLKYLDTRTLNNSGTVVFIAGIALRNGCTINNLSGGTFDVLSDTIFLSHNAGAATSFSNAGDLVKSSGAGTATIDALFDNAGTVDIQSGTLLLDQTSSNQAGGVFQGTGILNVAGVTFTNNGIINPGTSPGTLSVVGDLNQETSSIINIEIGGTVSGQDYDNLNVLGTATLAGILNVTLINSFNPVEGNSFTIMAYGAVAGDFDTTNLPGLAANLEWGIQKAAGGLILHVIATGADTDEDGLIDSDEFSNGTDFTDEDSDSDGYYDGEEVNMGSDPLSPGSTPAYSESAYYVDADATSLGDGSIGNPWRVLHHAIHVINNGSAGAYNLYIDAGLYTEIDNDGFEPDESLILTQDNVAVIGAPGAVLEGSYVQSSNWNRGLEISASNISVSGLEISDFWFDYYYGILISAGDGISINNCVINTNNYAVGVESGATSVSITNCEIFFHDRGGIDVEDSSILIARNQIYNNAFGIYIREYAGNNITPVIVNNLIYNELAWTDYGIALAADTAISPLIAHNTINGGRYGININGVDSPSMTIQYNIISSFTDYGIRDEGAAQSSLILDYNDVYSSEGGAVDYLNVTAGATDISEDPLYEDAANGVFHLQTGSPCIDAILTDDFVTDDLDGNSRPQGSGFDMGAYEQVDDSVPSVISSSPVNGAVGSGVDSTVAAFFSKDVDPTTVNAASMIVSAGGSQVAGSYAVNGYIVTFTPAIPLNYGTIYQVRITIDITDMAGTPLGGAFAWSFTTTGSGAQGAYFPTQSVISTDATTAFSVVAADIDDDGDLDVLSASDDDDTVEWFSNTDGNGAFGAPQTIRNSALGARSVFAGDINGDAIVDVLSASWGPTDESNPDMEFAWYENAFNAQPAGNFSPQNVLTIHTSPISIVAADMDNDGDLDVLTASYGDNTVAWIENTDGVGSTWTQHTISNTDTAAWDVFAADLDNDGDLDVLSASNSSNDVAWYENRLNEASQDFGPEIIISNSASGARVVRAADLDQDGDMDVISASWFDGRIAWYENLGGAFGDPASNQNIIATASENTQAMNVADMDNDGDVDVLYASWGSEHKIFWMENTDASGTTWTSHEISSAINGCQSLYAADLDDDGDLDVLSASQDDNKIAWYENTNAMPITYTLTKNQIGQGTIDQIPVGTVFAPDTVVTLTPSADDGYYFSEFRGALSGSALPGTVTMDADKTVTVVFLLKTAPDPPVADDPPDEATIPAGSSVPIETSNYHDPDGDDHVETIWEVWRADTDELLPGYQYTDAGLTDHVIPDNLLEEGLKYGWRLAYVDVDGNQRWSDEYFFKVGTPVSEALPEVAAGTSLGDFGMISIVHWPNDPDPQAVFDIDYDPDNYRIGRWDPVASQYIEFGDGLEMEPGHAYWILTRDPLVVNFNGIPVSTVHDLEVHLFTDPDTSKGWNMIAPPNDKNYHWKYLMVGRWFGPGHQDNVAPVYISDEAAAGLIDQRIWEWKDGSYTAYMPEDNFQLKRYKGYWAKAVTDGVYLVFSMDAQVANLSTPAKIWLAVQGKALEWIKNVLPKTREAIADSDSPPMPMGLFEDSVDPVFEGCFLDSVVSGQ